MATMKPTDDLQDSEDIDDIDELVDGSDTDDLDGELSGLDALSKDSPGELSPTAVGVAPSPAQTAQQQSIADDSQAGIDPEGSHNVLPPSANATVGPLSQTPSTREIEPASDITFTPNAQDSGATKEAAPATASWSWGSAWTTISSALQEDVHDLTVGFQKVLDNVKEEMSAPLDASEGEVLHETSKQGPTDADTSKVDEELDQGLQAIDGQVDRIATEAARALGSIWSGLNGALATGLTTAEEYAARMEDVAMHAANRVGGDGSSHRSTGEPMGIIQRMGKLLEGDANVYRGVDRDGLSESDWLIVDKMDEAGNAATVSFDLLFRVHRGLRFAEELEEFANSCAKKCNHARTQLSGTNKAELDAVMAMLAGIVDLAAQIPPDSTFTHTSIISSTCEGIAPSCSTLLSGETDTAFKGLNVSPTKGVPPGHPTGTAAPGNLELQAYAPLAGLCCAAAERAKGISERSILTMQRSHSLMHPNEASSSSAVEGTATDTPGMTAKEAEKEAENLMFVLRGEGVKLMAEFTALALQHLCLLARSLALQGESADLSMITWPTGNMERGTLLRLGIQQLLVDTSAISQAFHSAILEIGSSSIAYTISREVVRPGDDETTGGTTDGEWDDSLATIAATLAAGLEVDSGTAVDRIVQASKHLLYPACVAAVHHIVTTSEDPASPRTPSDGNKGAGKPTVSGDASAPA